MDGPFSLETALEPALMYGALGFCVATSVVIGIIVTIGVRAHSAPCEKAVLILAVSSIITGIASPLILIGSGAFRGESSLVIYFGALVAAIVSLFFFIMFTMIVLCAPKR